MALACHRGLAYPTWAVRAALDPEFVPPEPADVSHMTARHLGREIVHLGAVHGPWRGSAACDYLAVIAMRPSRTLVQLAVLTRPAYSPPIPGRRFVANSAGGDRLISSCPRMRTSRHTVRAAAHVHSEWSDDASWPLSRIAATFRPGSAIPSSLCPSTAAVSRRRSGDEYI